MRVIKVSSLLQEIVVLKERVTFLQKTTTAIPTTTTPQPTTTRPILREVNVILYINNNDFNK